MPILLEYIIAAYLKNVLQLICVYMLHVPHFRKKTYHSSTSSVHIFIHLKSNTSGFLVLQIWHEMEKHGKQFICSYGFEFSPEVIHSTQNLRLYICSTCFFSCDRQKMICSGNWVRLYLGHYPGRSLSFCVYREAWSILGTMHQGQFCIPVSNWTACM